MLDLTSYVEEAGCKNVIFYTYCPIFDPDLRIEFYGHLLNILPKKSYWTEMVLTKEVSDALVKRNIDIGGEYPFIFVE